MNVSVDNITEKTFDNFKKITPALVAVAILTGLLLFLPESILTKMNLDELPVMWNRIIGIVFLLSVALITTMIVFSILSRITSKRRNVRIRRNLKKRYMTLSPRQKAIIIQMLRSENKTISLEMNSGDTIYLQSNLFLYRPDQTISVGFDDRVMLTYVPQTWLLDLYNEEPELFR